SLLYILPSVIYPQHSSPVHTAHCHTICTYCPLSYPLHSSPVHNAHCHTLNTPVLYILPTVIPSTLLSYIAYCHSSKSPLHNFSLMCPLSYPPHSSTVHTAHCYTHHTLLLYILHTVIPSTLLSCTYCPMSCPPYSSIAHTAQCHTIHNLLLYILPTVMPSYSSIAHTSLCNILNTPLLYVNCCHTLSSPLPNKFATVTPFSLFSCKYYLLCTHVLYIMSYTLNSFPTTPGKKYGITILGKCSFNDLIV
ncbi:hypothetical protein AB205_0039010, partial [Aquarana catesbeiana]